jgi:hypothetical protein
MHKAQNCTRIGWLADGLALACVVVMFLAGHDIWNDTGRRDFWHLPGPPYFDVRVFVAAYYGLAAVTLGRVVMRIGVRVRRRKEGTSDEC